MTDINVRPSTAQRDDITVVAEAAPASAAVVIADPGPLGLAAFALTTFVLSVFNANIIGNAALSATVLPIALFYGGVAQFAAGMWEFRKGNTFGALAFSSYGMFWISFAAYAKFVAPGLPAGQIHEASGLFLLAWTIFTVIMLIAALQTNLVVAGVFLILTVTFAFLTVGALGNHEMITKIGGVLGLITAAAAWYGVAAGVVNSTWGRDVLPVFPVKK